MKVKTKPMELILRQVPKKFVPKKACLYLIAHPAFYLLSLEELLELIRAGVSGIYVGVTTMKVGKRYSDHTATRNGKPRHRTGPFIKTHGYTFDTCFRVLSEGEREDMLVLEADFRPESFMGLNEKVGG